MSAVIDKLNSINTKPYIIAEMACSHDGIFSKAEELIQVAVDANADAIQLQLFKTEHTVTPRHEVYETLKKIEFSEEQWDKLIEKGNSTGIDVWVCTYDLESLKYALKKPISGIKLNSSDLNNVEILKLLSEHPSIPFTIGTGSSTNHEIKCALDFFKESKDRITLVHGVQNFPTKIEDLNLSRVNYLKENFPEYKIGYADHTEGGSTFSLEVDLMAVSLGVRLIEKHINLDRSEKGIDYQAALEPEEFKIFVNKIEQGYKAMGFEIDKTEFSESDLKYRKFQKKSLVSNGDFEIGHKIMRDDISILRNKEVGVGSQEIDFFIGKELKGPLKKFENLTKEIV